MKQKIKYRCNAHQVDLCQNANGPGSLRIHFPRHFQPFRVGQVYVCCRNSENDTGRFRNVFEEHIPYLLFNVAWLVADWNLGDTGKIDQCQCENMWRVYAQINRKWGYSGVATSFRFRVTNNLVPNLGEVVELFVG